MKIQATFFLPPLLACTLNAMVIPQHDAGVSGLVFNEILDTFTNAYEQSQPSTKAKTSSEDLSSQGSNSQITKPAISDSNPGSNFPAVRREILGLPKAVDTNRFEVKSGGCSVRKRGGLKH